MSAHQASDIKLEPVHLSDVDLFSDWETELGWDIESIQLSVGPNEIGFDHFLFPDMLVGHFRSKQGMRNLFAIPHGLVVFLIPRAKLPFAWSGKHFAPTLMPIIRAGRENWSVLPSEWDCYEFMVSEDLLRRSELFPAWFLEQTSVLDHAFLPLIEPATGRFVRAMDAFFGEARAANAALDRRQLHEFIIDGLQQVVDAGLKALGSHTPPRPARRADLIVKAERLVSAQLHEDFTADEMAQALGVSRRALSYAFRDSLGIGPYQYVLTQRLHAVRRQLRSSDMSVTEACTAHGFYTPSRFARHYERLFGELPSETRSRSRRRTG